MFCFLFFWMLFRTNEIFWKLVKSYAGVAHAVPCAHAPSCYSTQERYPRGGGRKWSKKGVFGPPPKKGVFRPLLCTPPKTVQTLGNMYDVKYLHFRGWLSTGNLAKTGFLGGTLAEKLGGWFGPHPPFAGKLRESSDHGGNPRVLSGNLGPGETFPHHDRTIATLRREHIRQV